MKIICRPRQSGKTTQLILESYLTKKPIICLSFKHKKTIKNRVKELNLDIPNPIIYWEFKNEIHRSKDKDEYLLDNADLLLNKIFNGKLSTITLTKGDDK
jgi:hypothetical protein